MTVDAGNVANPHDALFKDIFERPEHARAELRCILPRRLAQTLDWTSLALVPGDHRDASMAEYHTDLLFSVRSRDRGGPLLYLLLEHQSTPDPRMAFRLLQYMVLKWDRWLKTHKRARRLSLIVPVVFYHGRKAWSAPCDFESLITVPTGLGDAVREFVPPFRYLVDDLSRVSDEELRRRALPPVSLLAVVSLRDLRHKRLVDTFRPWMNKWADVVRSRHAFDDLRYVMRYISKLKDAEEIKEFDRFLEHELGSDGKGIMISLYDQLIQEGIERGIQQGIEEGKRLMAPHHAQLIGQGERKLLLKQLCERFGSLDAETERRIATATIEQIETWGTRVLFAATLAEVVAD